MIEFETVEQLNVDIAVEQYKGGRVGDINKKSRCIVDVSRTNFFFFLETKIDYVNLRMNSNCFFFYTAATVQNMFLSTYFNVLRVIKDVRT